MLESSVILQGPYNGGSYTMREFYEGLEKALHEKVGGFVLGLGPLVKSNEFYLAVNSREIRDKLILCGSIVVKEHNFKIRSTDATRFTARVHWAPPFVPSSAIAEALGTECNVETIVYEMCKEEGFETVATGVRLVTLVGDRKKLPHLASITNPLNGHSYELLVTVPGGYHCASSVSAQATSEGPVRRRLAATIINMVTLQSCSYKKATYANVARSSLLFSETVQTGTGGRSGGANSGTATGRGVNNNSREANACSVNGAASHTA